MLDDTAVGKHRCDSGSDPSPFVVEWDATDLATFEGSAARDLVFVKYHGCELELMRGCSDSGGSSTVVLPPTAAAAASSASPTPAASGVSSGAGGGGLTGGVGQVDFARLEQEMLARKQAYLQFAATGGGFDAQIIRLDLGLPIDRGPIDHDLDFIDRRPRRPPATIPPPGLLRVRLVPGLLGRSSHWTDSSSRASSQKDDSYSAA